VSSRWLLLGEGHFPKSLDELNAEKKADMIPNAIEEAMAFKRANTHHEIFVHNDHSLFPDFNVGDILAGVSIEKGDWSNMLGHLVIVKTSHPQLYCRRLFRSYEKNYFNLIAINPDIEHSVIYHQKVWDIYKIRRVYKL